MTTVYVYPFVDFVRDLEAVRKPLTDGSKRDFFAGMRGIIDYMKTTYSDDIDRTERGAVLAHVSSFLSRHMDSFDVGKIAVSGPSCSLVSDHLMRAVHWLVVPVALGAGDRSPGPAEVLALAQSLEEHARIEKEAEQVVAPNGP